MDARGMLFAVALVGCTKPEDYSPKETASAVAPLVSASATPLPRLPAHFGPAELAKVACVKAEGDALQGKDCTGGFALFGPYAHVAAGSDVAYSFAIRPSEDVTVMVEMVADTGKVLFAALDGSAKKDEVARFSLRTRPQIDAQNLEARVVVGGQRKLNYTITDLALDVH